MDMGGVDADGNATDTCALVGTVRLTRYMDDDEYEALRAHFPELNIVQPEYTLIEFDDDVADDANVSNLDNGRGPREAHGRDPCRQRERLFQTYYCDKYWISTAAGRVVCRGYSYAVANGGVSVAFAFNDASYSDACRGSRLAFRGKLVRAGSVAAYKAAVEVA